MTTSAVSPDGQAIALACTSLALTGDQSLKPLTPTDWNKLSIALHTADLRPRDLLGLGAGDVRESLGLAAEPADRLAGLLSRGGQLALEVERLSSRGIWIVTRADEEYPVTLKERLGGQAPPLLFGAGPQAALQQKAIAVVGSRNVDEAGIEFSSALGARCAEQEYAVVSGAARGVDLTAMHGAISRGGAAVGVTVEPLERLVKKSELRAAIADELLTLATPFHPAARWHQGNAMRRNRLIYALAQAAIVVASSAENGGTRAGALENLKSKWVPLHVRDDGSPGNRRLISEGARALAIGRESEIDLAQLTKDPQSSLLEAEADPDPTPVADGGQDDAFFVIWPLLAQSLREPLGEKEVATKLQLQLTQARAWLKRAVDEGQVEVTKRPKRYLLRDTPREQLRIDDA